jgi:HlyD family secretion protein
MTTSAQRTAETAATRRPRRGKGWRRFVPWVIGAAIVGAIIMSLRPKPIEVETAKVSKGPLTVSVLEEGKTRIRHRYIISPPIPGFLNRIPFRAGARIEAGKTVLASIQPQVAGFLDARSRMEAEARLRATEAAKLQREAQLERAKSTLDLAEKEMARMKTLRKSGSVAERDWEMAENQAAVLGRELRAAEFATQVAEFERAQAEAVLLQTQNPTGEPAKPMDLLAPVTGFILNVYEESARAVTAGMPLMEVGSPTDLEAEIEMLSSDAVGVRPGADVMIEQWGGDAPVRGRVTMVEPGGFTKISALGVEEQRVKVRVEFAEPLPDGKFLGDRYRVEARVVTWHGDSVLQIPTGALFRRGGDWMTFVERDGKAVQTKVEIAHNSGTSAEILSGLKEGDAVILHPSDAITDGRAVRARETESH